MAINKVFLLGNLTRDPELRFSAKGTAVANLTIAVNEKWKNDAGEDKESVSFVDAVCFGKRAETYAQHHRKGSKTLIEGKLKTESWDDKATGQKRSKLVVHLDGFEFVGDAKQQTDAATRPVQAPAQRTSAPQTQDAAPANDDSSDVPF